LLCRITIGNVYEVDTAQVMPLVRALWRRRWLVVGTAWLVCAAGWIGAEKMAGSNRVDMDSAQQFLVDMDSAQRFLDDEIASCIRGGYLIERSPIVERLQGLRRYFDRLLLEHTEEDPNVKVALPIARVMAEATKLSGGGAGRETWDRCQRHMRSPLFMLVF
jgi:hypothetical protein